MQTQLTTEQVQKTVKWIAAILVLSCLVGIQASPPAAMAQSPETTGSPQPPDYLIKAAYLYNFAMFVEWAPNAFAGVDSPIVIGVLGPDPFGWALDRAVEGKKINNRAIIIKRLQLDQDLGQCHILFVSAEVSAVGELARRLEGQSVLLIGETPDFAKLGGTVNFTVENDKVRFEINPDAAERAPLSISSKLLSLARIVRGS